MLSNVHYAVNWCCLFGLAKLAPGWVPTLEDSSRRTPLWRDANFVAMAVLLGTVTPLNNMSLQLNPIGFYQVAKLAVTPGVVVLERLLDGKTPSRGRAACLVAVCFFVVKMHGARDAAGDPVSAAGLAAVGLWVPLAAGYKVQFGRLRRHLGNCSTMGLMYALFPYAIAVQLLLSPLVDPPGVTSYAWTPRSLALVLASGLGAFLVNYSGFLVIGHLGGIAHVLLGQAKSAGTMLAAAVVFGTSYAAAELLCAAGAMASICAYAALS